MSQTVEQRVFKIAAEQFEVNQGELTRDSSLVADLDGDSLDQLEFVMALEDEFEMELSDEQGEAIKTIGDAVCMFESLVK